MSHTNETIVTMALRGKNAHNGRGSMSTDHYRADFTRYGAPYVGHLPPRLVEILHARFTAGAITQVIYSYSTPIAWLDGDVWVVPEVTYSATTSSKHQSQLYRLHPLYIPRDAGMEEYMRVISGYARYDFHGANKRHYRAA